MLHNGKAAGNGPTIDIFHPHSHCFQGLRWDRYLGLRAQRINYLLQRPANNNAIQGLDRCWLRACKCWEFINFGQLSGPLSQCCVQWARRATRPTASYWRVCIQRSWKCDYDCEKHGEVSASSEPISICRRRWCVTTFKFGAPSRTDPPIDD